MSIEPYQWLMAHSGKLGIHQDSIGPASVDLRLGAIEPLYTSSNNHAIILEPGKFYLASTLEYVTVPVTHCAFVHMRSSLARKGLGHKMAGFVDPGFEGQITLELETSCRIETYRVERIVQLIFARLTEPTAKPYAGRYQGQRGPTRAYNT